MAKCVSGTGPAEDEHALALAAMAIAQRLLDSPADPDALAAGRRFLAEHTEARARSRSVIAAISAAHDSAGRSARVDRDLGDLYGPLDAIAN